MSKSKQKPRQEPSVVNQQPSTDSRDRTADSRQPLADSRVSDSQQSIAESGIADSGQPIADSRISDSRQPTAEPIYQNPIGNEPLSQGSHGGGRSLSGAGASISDSRKPTADSYIADSRQPLAGSRISDSRQQIADSCSSDEINLLEYLRIINKYRWMILGMTILAIAVTVVLSLRQPRMYEANASIVPPIDRLPQGGGMASKLSGAQAVLMKGMLNQRNLSALYVGILKSYVVSEALVDRFDLMNVHEMPITRTDARAILSARTEFQESKEGIVHITVRDHDAKQAAAIANAYIEELDQQNKRLSGGQATAKRVFLENRIKEIQGDLSKIQSLQSHEVKIKEILFEFLSRECEMAKIEEAKNMPSIQILDQAIIPERPLGRGILKKGILAGVVSIMFGIFAAFGLQNIADLRGAGR